MQNYPKQVECQHKRIDGQSLILKNKIDMQLTQNDAPIKEILELCELDEEWKPYQNRFYTCFKIESSNWQKRLIIILSYQKVAT